MSTFTVIRIRVLDHDMMNRVIQSVQSAQWEAQRRMQLASARDAAVRQAQERRQAELEKQRQDREICRAREEQDRAVKEELARKEAAEIVKKMDAQATSKAQLTNHSASLPREDTYPPVALQQYAKEKVLQQLDILQQYGVSLGGIEHLEDGTIEITLKG